MSKGLRLSEKYGLNPTLGVCICCGKETGEIGLLGANRGEEAPRQSVLSIEPCQTCKDTLLVDGTLLIEAHEDGKPTGKIAVITDEAYSRICKLPAPKKIALVEVGVFEKLGIKL